MYCKEPIFGLRKAMSLSASNLGVWGLKQVVACPA